MLRALATLLVLVGASSLPADAQVRAVPQSREQIQLSFAPVVKRVAPAVVNVYSRRVVRSSGLSPLLNDPLFRRFFGDAVPDAPQRVQNALGSGVVVSPDGLIVTNHHVVKEADEVTIVLADRREFEAQVLRLDERTDLAVLKIDPRGEAMPFLELRDSDELQVGDLVLAVGNPFGIGQTVTSGIVSGLARTAVGVTDYRFFIQTDAAINPGNSGGALVTLDGRLVGINTAIFSQTGGSVGIGFAIPTAMVRSVLASVGQGKRIVRPWFGASTQDLTQEIASNLGLGRPLGALVKEVVADSPAARAGLRPGDVILAVGGHDIEDPEALRFRLATLPVSGSTTLTIWRNGAQRQATLQLAPPPENPPRAITELRGQQPLAGAVIANLSPALADEIGLDTTLRGVIVLGIGRNSPARRLGIATGDIVLSVNDEAVRDVAHLQRLLESARSGWRIAVRRGERVLRVQVNG